MPGHVTIKDIAVQLGISHATVSRALSGHPHVSSETRARVQAAVASLGYIPNLGARVLRGQSSTLLGLIVPDIENDFYATVAKAMAESANEAAHQLVLAITGDDPDSELRHVRELSEARVAGIVAVPGRALRRETAALLSLIPVVQMIRRTPLLRADWMGVDDEAGLASGVGHLVALGHRRIAYIGGEEVLSTGRARRDGFVHGLRSAGLEPAPALIALGPPRAVVARDALHRLWQQSTPPTAVVLGGGRVTLGALQAIDDLGLAVPRDLSVVGFGDPAWYTWCGPGLTTLSLPVRDIAFAGAALLLRRVRERLDKDAEPGPIAEATFPASLVVRGSTAEPPARKPHKPRQASSAHPRT